MRLLRPLRLLVPLVAVGGALVIFLVFGFLAYQGGTGGGARFVPGYCDAGLRSATQSGRGQSGDTAATLSAEQRQNATTIIGVAKQKGAPPRAWLVALATAKQESDLRNINYGDRDSLGLFQQRPSQGWGTPAQIRDPVYATNAFYDVLVKIEGYQDLPITTAAQKVQRSAFPAAYAEHEPEARVLASALTGYSPAGLTCVLTRVDGAPGHPADVVAAASREIGARGTVEGSSVRFTPTGRTATATAWALAQWAVSRADGLKVTSVQTAGQRWDRNRPDRGWTRSAGAPAAGTVVVGLG
jgi:hypothetical protein